MILLIIRRWRVQVLNLLKCHLNTTMQLLLPGEVVIWTLVEMESKMLANFSNKQLGLTKISNQLSLSCLQVKLLLISTKRHSQ